LQEIEKSLNYELIIDLEKIQKVFSESNIILPDSLVHNYANCLINNLTIEIIVASKKMLLYSEYLYSLEGAYDESTEQTRITTGNTTTLSQGQ
jgi:hypothetical protein